MANSTELSIVIRAKNAAQAALAQLDSQLKALAAKAQSFHAELRAVGLALTAVAVIGAGAMTIATKAAGDLELQMFNVRKTTDMSAQEIDKLKKSFIDMSAHLPVSAVELAKIGAVAGQLGVNGRKNIESFTETVAMISTVTDLTVENAANSMARLANLFKMPMADIRKLGGVINEMENTTTAKAANMVEFMLRMATSAKTLGMKAPDVAGLAATLIDLGFNAELAGTAVSNAFNDMIKDADKFGLSMGMSGAQFRKGMETDAIGTFQKWAQAMKALPKEEMLRTFDELGLSASRETSVFMSLVGAVDKLAVNTANANKEFLLGTSLQKEFDTFMQATWNQVKLLTNVMQGFATMMGDVLLPILKSVVKVGQEGFLWLQRLPEWARTAIVGIVALGAAVTGLLGGLAIFGAILPSLTAGLALIGTMAVAAAPALGTLAVTVGGAVAASAPLLGALAAAIGGVTWAWVEWQKTKPATGEEKALEATKKNTKAIQDKAAAINQMKTSALSAQNALDDAFKTLGLVQVEKEIKHLEAAYKTLESSGKATGETLSQAWDNMQAKIKKLKGEVDETDEAFKLLGAESIASAADRLEKLASAYQEVKASGEASAITIANAWLKLNDEQEKTNNFAKAWEGFITARVLPAVNNYVSAMQSATAAQVAASRTTFDTKLKDIADSAKNAGNSIADIDAKMAGKFSAGAKKAEEQARAIDNLRQAANAHADDIDRFGNAQIAQYGRVIDALRNVGAENRQVQEYAISAGKEYLSLLEARLSAERAGLAEMIKIRDENINGYRQSQEAIKQLKEQSLDVDKKSQDLKDALADKNFTAEENAVRQTLRLRMQMYDMENMANDRKMKVLGEIGQKAAQLSMTMKAGSLQEYNASVLAQEAYAREKELLAKVNEEKNKEAELALKNSKAFELSIAKQREMISGLATTVQSLNKVLTDSKLEAKITLLDEALAPAKKLKAELEDLYGKDIFQKINLTVSEINGGANNTGKSFIPTIDNPKGLNLNEQFGEPSGEGDSLPGYASGISYVPRDQVARIHQGEAVLTKEENRRYREGKTGNVTFGDINIHPPKGVEITSAIALEIRKKLEQLGRRVR